jgi:hypothetical protein
MCVSVNELEWMERIGVVFIDYRRSGGARGRGRISLFVYSR